MTTNAATLFRHAARAAAALALVASTGCNLAKTKEPALAGPSEYGYSINVQSHTDRLPQDGASVARVTATVLDQGGNPAAEFFLLWSVSASNGAFVEPSEQQTKTNAQGQSTITVTAPTPPAFVPASAARLQITARPVGHDALSTDNYRTIEVQLIPPAGTLPINNPPVPAFTISPVIGSINQTITFDASLTKDEGEPCGALCSYQWNFGDFEPGSGMVVTHAYSRRADPAASFTVTLTVTDSRGGVASTTKTLIITGPDVPLATFTPATITIASGGEVTFVGPAPRIGATVEYEWNFGDGNGETTSDQIVRHTFTHPGGPGAPPPNVIRTVQLRVTDNFGQTAVSTGQVTVTP